MSNATAAALVCALVLAPGCARRLDVSGTGDDRLDEPTRGDVAPAGQAREERCGDGGGTLLLLDAATAAPLSCTLVTISQEAEDCQPEDPGCGSRELFRGRTGVRGLAALGSVPWETARISAVAAGYRPSTRDPAPLQPGEVAEIEMLPAEGFTLKLVDEEGNYLPQLTVTFKQQGEAIAQMTTNELANVHFRRRSPFSGEPVIVEATGFSPVTVNGPENLGSDGHTVTLTK